MMAGVLLKPITESQTTKRKEMKKLLTTFAVCMAFSMPAFAADKTIGDFTIAEADWTTLITDVQGYVDGETGEARVERLVAELVTMADEGKRYSPRWNKVVSVAFKEGWGAELQDIVLTPIIGANGPTLAEHNAVKAERDYWYDRHAAIFVAQLTKNSYDVLAPNATEAMIDAAWSEYNIEQEIATTVEDAFKDGYDKGYSEGYADGFADGFVAGSSQ